MNRHRLLITIRLVTLWLRCPNHDIVVAIVVCVDTLHHLYYFPVGHGLLYILPLLSTTMRPDSQGSNISLDMCIY